MRKLLFILAVLLPNELCGQLALFTRMDNLYGHPHMISAKDMSVEFDREGRMIALDMNNLVVRVEWSEDYTEAKLFKGQFSSDAHPFFEYVYVEENSPERLTVYNGLLRSSYFFDSEGRLYKVDTEAIIDGGYLNHDIREFLYEGKSRIPKEMYLPLVNYKSPFKYELLDEHDNPLRYHLTMPDGNDSIMDRTITYYDL